MNTATVMQIETSFLSFFETSQRALEIKEEDDYQFALDLLEQLMTNAEDREGDPLLYLIDIVSDAIEQYEDNLENVKNYIKDINASDAGVAVLRALIDQYNLTYSDLKEEIGSKSLISQILNGSKKLTKNHIANLSKRFNISPQLFFN